MRCSDEEGGSRSSLLLMQFNVGRPNWDSWLIVVMLSGVMGLDLGSEEEPLTTREWAL